MIKETLPTSFNEAGITHGHSCKNSKKNIGTVHLDHIFSRNTALISHFGIDQYVIPPSQKKKENHMINFMTRAKDL